MIERKNLYIGCVPGPNPPPDGGHTFVLRDSDAYVRCAFCKVRPYAADTECRRPLGAPMEIHDRRGFTDPIHACETESGTRGHWRELDRRCPGCGKTHNTYFRRNALKPEYCSSECLYSGANL